MTDKETVGDAGVTRTLKQAMMLANLDFVIAKYVTYSHGRTLDPKRVSFKVFRDRMGVIQSHKV